MGPWSAFLNDDGRVIHKRKHYSPGHERHFSHYVNRPVTFLAIGRGPGGSLQMWKKFLGPNAQIIGIDTNFLYPRTARDGVYMAEDPHTAYLPDYEIGLHRAGTFIEPCKNLIDEWDADWGPELASAGFTAITRSMNVYDSLAVFEHGWTLPKSAPTMPPP